MKKKSNKKPVILPVIPDQIYCANDCCDSEAQWATSNKMPLCDSCAAMFRLGQENPEPLEQI